MFFRIISFYKSTVPPDDGLAVPQEPHGFCSGLHRFTAAFNGHKTLALNDLHQRIVDVFREVDLALKSQIMLIKAAFCFLLVGGGEKYQRRVFQVGYFYLIKLCKGRISDIST